MTVRLSSALLCASTVLVGCSAGAASFESAPLDTDDQKASYGIGMSMGGQLSDARDRLDLQALMRGLQDGLQGNQGALPQAEIQAVLTQFSADIERAAAEEAVRVAQENGSQGEAYQAENGAKDGVVTTESGLQYEVLREGDGPRPTRESRVRLHYRGTLVDGTEFDSSYGGEPATFPASGLISGFTEALLLMPVGSHYRVVIPPDIGYGSGGSGPIGPNSTLIFEIELLDIVDGA